MVDDMTNDDVNSKISLDEKMAVFYIAGYLAFKHKNLSGNALDASPERKANFNAVNRKNLCQPSEAFFLFMLLAYYYFTHSQEMFCRKCLVQTLPMFFGLICLEVEVPIRFANILLNNCRKKFSQISNEATRKRVKLISQSTSSC
ncbi:hypothetical protein PoB_005101100 [Plakobranchus ocellatus]|uniref:Uncharacterized protein n=1 Tax=Plakobranchus ocellatus TaxID=259542 RepID=A0AAV4BMJ0_9GAST|nr:hypothetical protein PoB_005101100 [Plakobranchus ocellatus]